MKRLILLRHAKAVAKDAAHDRDRALAPEGRAEMKPVAPYLAQGDRRPDLALISTAKRTRETWDLASAGLGSVAVAFEDEIYEAAPETLLGVIQEADGAVADGPLETLILVGHNPGVSDLAQMLVGKGPEAARAALARGMPTAGVAIIDFDIAAWSEAAERIGVLVEFVSPASLGTAR